MSYINADACLMLMPFQIILMPVPIVQSQPDPPQGFGRTRQRHVARADQALAELLHVCSRPYGIKAGNLAGGKHIRMATQGELEQLIRSILDAEMASGFRRSGESPALILGRSWIIAALESGECDSLLEAFAANGVFLLSPDRDPKLHAYQSGHSAYRRFVEAMPKLFGWKYDRCDFGAVSSAIFGRRIHPPNSRLASHAGDFTSFWH